MGCTKYHPTMSIENDCSFTQELYHGQLFHLEIKDIWRAWILQEDENICKYHTHVIKTKQGWRNANFYMTIFLYDVYLFSPEVTRNYRQINGAYKLCNNYDVNLKSKPLKISCTLTISSQCSLSIPLKILENQRLILRWHLHGSKRLSFNCH